MSVDSKSIESQALELTEKERAALAQKLINSLDKVVEVDVEESWKTEVAKRKAELSSGKVKPVSGHKVMESARKRIQK